MHQISSAIAWLLKLSDRGRMSRMFNGLVFLAVNAHSHTTHQTPFTEVNVVKKNIWKPFTNRTTDVKYKPKKQFFIKEDFPLKDGQTDYLFKQSMKTEVRERFHLERVEALLFVASTVYKSSWWEGRKTLKRLEQLFFCCYFKNCVFLSPLIFHLH